MILANIYIDRLLHNRHFTVTSLNVRHLLLTALLVATKFIDDSFYSNRMFADAGMVSLDELNRMERIFLTSIGYSALRQLIAVRDLFEQFPRPCVLYELFALSSVDAFCGV